MATEPALRVAVGSDRVWALPFCYLEWPGLGMTLRLPPAE